MTGVGEDPFICICADGFDGDTCNLTETGRAEKRASWGENRAEIEVFPPCSPQDPAAQTPAGTTGPARPWVRADEATSSVNTCAGVRRASRACTARPVSPCRFYTGVFILPQTAALKETSPSAALKGAHSLLCALFLCILRITASKSLSIHKSSFLGPIQSS